METRKLYQETIALYRDLEQMIFVSGPRQSGKTTLAHMISEEFDTSIYFNWDISTDRRKLRTEPYFYEHLDRPRNTAALVIFDEIHKYSS